MIQIKELLGWAIKKQGLELKIHEIPFNVFLKNTGDILTLCFFEDETDECMIIVETNLIGGEELRIIPKENIEYISIFYDFSDLEDDKGDKMFL